MTAPHLPCTLEISGRPGVWAAASVDDDDRLAWTPFHVPLPPLETDRLVMPADFLSLWTRQAMEHRGTQKPTGILSRLGRIFDPQVVMTASSGPQVFTRLFFDGTYLRRRYVAARLEPRWSDVIEVDDAAQRVELDDGMTRFDFPEDDPPLVVPGGRLKVYPCFGDQWFYRIDRSKHDQVLLIEIRNAPS